jgi:hypothetical protein
MRDVVPQLLLKVKPSSTPGAFLVCFPGVELVVWRAGPPDKRLAPLEARYLMVRNPVPLAVLPLERP